MKKVAVSFLLGLVFFAACTSDVNKELKSQALEAIEKGDYDLAISHLEQGLQKKPKDAELHYLLGQAYRELQFKDGSQINQLNLEMGEKASAEFKKAIEISPDYKGRKFVVGPYTKIQSIWGAIAMAYVEAGDIDAAVNAFKRGREEGGYYPAIMEYNRNIMASCEPNAILFTNGDNDTYPMWYLQLVDGYRKDINVVNLSLLNVPWYIKQLKNTYPFGDNRVSMNLTEEEIDVLKPQKWQTQTVVIPGSDTENEISWSVAPTINDVAVRVQDVMVMQIVHVNKWQRPVYFSCTVAQVNKINLNPYLSLEGLVMRLVSEKQDISVDRLQKNCFETYTYEGVNDKRFQYIDELHSMYQNYRAGFMLLADFYSREGDLAEVAKTIEFMNAKLPQEKYPWANAKQKKYADSLLRKALKGE
ncbi:MAG: tetratricopeptide repeat protein [Deferribacteres bacterium]|nr:tetratricopeptide repeat protein [candidate division KSB1 bacterium]MCB9503711.1 tetratricopeptide repeat protein [Deferribacteres bacterium]